MSWLRVLVVMCLLGASPTWAQQPLTVRAVVDAKFRTLVDTCFGRSTFTDRFVPSPIALHPTIGESDYVHVSGISFRGLSTYTFSPNATLREARSGANADFLSQLDLGAEDLAGNADFDNLLYSVSCTSALKTALDAGFNPAPFVGPTLNVKAGLAAEAGNMNNSGLLVLYGRFASPLGRMLSEQKDIGRRMKGYAAVWEHLARTGATNRTLLDYVEGWLVSTMSAREAKTALTVNASANVSALVLNANWSNEAKVSYNSQFRNQTFDVFVASVPDGNGVRRPNFRMYSMPTVAEITKEVERAATINPLRAEIVQGREAEFKVSIPGLSQSICGTPGAWRASSEPSNGVVSVVPGFNATEQMCVLTIGARVTPSAIELPLTFFIENVRHMVNGVAVKFAQSARYVNAPFPLLRLSDVPKFEVSSDKMTVRLNVTAPVAWELAPGTSATDVQIADSQISCNGLAPIRAMTSSYAVTPTQAIHSLFPFRERDQVPTGLCKWTAVVNFTAGGMRGQANPAYDIALSPSLMPGQ